MKVERAGRSPGNGPGYGLVSGVPPFTESGIVAEQRAIAALVAEELGLTLEHFTSWRVVRFALDSSASVTLFVD